MKQFGANPLYTGSKNIFIADIHGEGDKLESLVNNLKNNIPNLKEYRLVFLGDLIGKGQQTIKTLQIMKQLQKEYEVIILRGNWEEKFFPDFEKNVMLRHHDNVIDFIANYKKYSFFMEFHNKGFTTLESILEYWKEQDFYSVFKDMKLYFETESTLATHAPLTNDFLERMIQNNRTLDQHEITLTSKFVENEAEELKMLEGKLFICGHQNCAVKDIVRKTPSIYGNKIFLDCGGAGTTLKFPIYAYIEDSAEFVHS